MSKKIGRNDKCICGSGKKYKNCCINKVDDNILEPMLFDNIELDAEPNIDVELLKVLIPIFNEYDFSCLARAVFCINSFRGNRPELIYYLTMNKALVECEKTGTKRIDTYVEFKAFFDCIKKHYLHSGMMVDENIPDFGDVKILYNNSFYPVFLGTGHNFVYSIMQLLYPLAQFAQKVDEVEEVLIYVKNMVNALEDSNPYDAKKSYGKLFLPSAKHFKACCAYYGGITKQDFCKSLDEILVKPCKIVEKMHFFKHDIIYYPLFNPSIIIDAYHNVLDKLPKDGEDNFAGIALLDIIENNFVENPKSKKFFFPTGVIEDEAKQKLLGDRYCPFLLLGDKRALLLIDENGFKGKQLINYVSAIKKKHADGTLVFIELSEKKSTHIVIKKEMDLTILSFDSHIRIDQNFMKPLTATDFFRRTVLELVYIFHSAESIDEICEFFEYKKNSSIVNHGFDGCTSFFDAWKSSNKEISQGAHEINILGIDLNLPEWNMFKKYREYKAFYPFDSFSYMFRNPDKWIKKYEEHGFNFIVNKAMSGCGGKIKRVNNTTLFLFSNLTFYEKDELNRHSTEAHRMLDDLVTRAFNLYEDVLITAGFFCAHGIQLSHMPTNYAKKVDSVGFMDEERTYVFGDSNYIDGRLLIRYTVDTEKLFKDLSETKTRVVECNFFIELLKCAEEHFNFPEAEKAIANDYNKKKEASISFEQREYYTSDKNFVSWADTESFIKVRKKIATLVKNTGVVAGQYNNAQAKDVIRLVQTTLIADFESEVIKYNRINLHEKLLSMLAHYQDSKNSSDSRYKLTKEDLEDTLKATTQEITLKEKDKAKSRIIYLLYFIETNLFLERDGGKIIETEELDYLIAYTDWLGVLQNNADAAHWLNIALQYPNADKITKDQVAIQVEDDFRINTVSELDKDEVLTRYKRIQENKNYLPKDVDLDIDIAKKCFSNDQGIELDDILFVSRYLWLEFSATFKDNEIYPDVFKVNKQSLLDDLMSIITDKEKYPISIIKPALEFLIIDPKRLKTIWKKGKQVEDPLLPVWERENRDNRFNLKPICEDGNDIIFSPIIMHEFYWTWVYGIINLYLPYQCGLPSLCAEVKKTKEACEKQMEIDVADLFRGRNRIVLPSFKFHTQDKGGNHPEKLGDYDILCIDEDSKTIWNIECKFLQYVGTFFEASNDQRRFFLESSNYVDKFQGRIDYLTANVETFLRINKINPKEHYVIKNYFVTNKVYESSFRKVSIDIITYDELRKKLEIDDV